MAPGKAEYSDVDTEASRLRGVQFGVTVEELQDLKENQDLEKLMSWGGVSGLAQKLGSDSERGLPQDEIDSNFVQRHQIFNVNVYPEPEPATFLELFLAALNDPTIMILGGAAVIALITGLIEDPGLGWIEGTAIMIAIFIVAFVTAINDYEKEKQFRQLNAAKNNRPVKVIRAGEQMTVSVFEVNVGDVIQLDTGDQVPADGIFISGYNMTVDESVMTGESDSVRKRENKPFMLSGCQVDAGVGKMLVTAVGPNSEWGQTLAKLQQESDETPLQQKLEKLANQIGQGGLAVAVVVFVLRMIYWIVDLAQDDIDFSWTDEAGVLSSHGGVLGFFIAAVTIVVVAVPEGLPLAVTIALAYSMKKMMADNNLVRRLEACETMGNATNICSDKTGTLTQNRMTVVKGIFGGQFYDHAPMADEIGTRLVELVSQVSSLNSSESSYVRKGEDGRLEFIGSKTECALLVLTNKWEISYEQMRKTIKKRELYAFSSDRKRMSCIVHHPSGGNGFRLLTKGASEIVLGLCTNVVSADGTVTTLTEAHKEEYTNRITEMASQGLRTLCLAYKDFPEDGGAAWSEADNVEQDLTCIAIVGINDPVRPEVPAAVLSCQKAGITVRMVTGDNILTAKDIARQCGILTEGGISMEGKDFRKLAPAEMDAILPKLQVLARSSPNDKYILVNRLRQLGEVVAVTGDGTNDGPALKEADVGFSMGLSGTEVAMEASDVVLLDDNFSSLVRAVVWGRSVFDNIRKFIQFQLTVNIVALVISFVAACNPDESELPLKPVQLLWVNLIMDTMGALALSTEAPTDALLNRRPYGRHEPLISPNMWRNILSQSFYQLIVLSIIYFAGSDLFDLVTDCNDDQQACIDKCGIPLADDSESLNEFEDCVEEFEEEELTILYTILFNSFVWCQIFNEINSRKLNNEKNPFKGMFHSSLFVIIIVITVGLQVFIVEVGGDFTSTHGLTSSQWGWCLLFGFISMPVSLLSRFIHVPDKYLDTPSGTAMGGPSGVEMQPVRPFVQTSDVSVQTMPVKILPLDDADAADN
eukprot:Rmarinus@m.10054